MALSQTAALAQIRDLVAAISGISRCYSPSETDGEQLPSAISEFPTVIVLPGPTDDYRLGSGGHRHTYEVHLTVYCQQGSSVGESANQALPILDSVISKFVDNVTLGGRVAMCLFARSSGLGIQSYADVDYIGGDIILRVSEVASVAPAAGS